MARSHAALVAAGTGALVLLSTIGAAQAIAPPRATATSEATAASRTTQSHLVTERASGPLWSGRWEVEGDSDEDGVFERFGVLKLQLVTDGSLDHLHLDPDSPCAETDRKYLGTYKFGSGGTVELCEIAQFEYDLYGEYYGNDGFWGQANMAHQGGSPATWAGTYSPPTDGQHPHQAYLAWRGTRLECTKNCIDPVIFVPGFLGTEIGCPRSDFFDELWPDAPTPEFYNMRLNGKGTKNHPKGNTCNKNAEPGEVIGKAFGQDVYAGIKKYLRSLPGLKSYFFGYDWRMSPGNPETQQRLDRLVNRARVETGRKKVTLVAHSMGGLVSRWYVGDHARKVARVVTMGTPYWGAPKPWLALKHGLTGPPTDSWWPDLDSFIPDDELQAFAVNALGAYYLYPSPAYYEHQGGWLAWDEVAPGTLTAQQTVDAVDHAGGNGALYDEALAAHTARLDSFGGSGSIDWQMIVGTGLQTLTYVAETASGPVYEYGNGDGTVPTISAAQGAVHGEAYVHYVCGIEHASLPGADEVQQMIRDFVLIGGAIPNPHPGGC